MQTLIERIELSTLACQVLGKEFQPELLGRLANTQLELELIPDLKAFVEECESETLNFEVAGAQRAQKWEWGWAGGGVIGSAEGAPEDNIPYYFAKNTHLRLRGDVFFDHSKYSEFLMLRSLQAFVFACQNYFPFDQVNAVVEYGCGTGHNIEFLKKILPGGINWGGCDWASSAIKRIARKEIVSRELAMQVDYFKPDTFWAPSRPFIAFTNASLEQSGSKYQLFMDFLIDNPMCLGAIHIEPVRELLSKSMLDQNSYKYAEQRGYLTGFLSFLKSRGVKILESRDFEIGSKYLSGYQVVVWSS